MQLCIRTLGGGIIMKVQVSKTVKDLYQESHKNYQYALESLLNSLDPATYVKALQDVKKMDSVTDMVEIEIPDSTVNMLKDLLDVEEVKNEIIGVLLWVAVLLPEI